MRSMFLSKPKWLLLFSLLLSPNIVYAVEKIGVVALFKDQAMFNIDGKQRLIKKGKRSPEGVLLISANSDQAVIEINGEQRTLKLGSHISNVFKNTTKKTTLILAPNSRGMYFLGGSINGFQVEFVLDTGATFVSMNRNVAKRIGLNYKLEGEKSQSQTANGLSTIYIMNLKRVKVGDIELRDVKGSVHDSDSPTVVLLGNSFLNKLDMQREGRVMKLTK